MGLSKQHHEGFAQFFEKPMRETLYELIKTSIGEMDYLDFKEKWDDDNSKLAKYILSLANSGGGAIVYGVKERDDGSIESVGLDSLRNKSDINKGIKAYLPEEVTYDVFDFQYNENSEHLEIQGKKFQVILVEYEPNFIPFIAKKNGKSIKDNVVYIRRGTNSDEATYNELQKLINIRVETGYSSQPILELSEHLAQLKVLYKANAAQQFDLGLNMLLLGDYRAFIKKMIELKKKKIIEELDCTHL